MERIIMKKPSKAELIEMLERVQSKLSEHQKEDKKIMRGYTLAANIDGMTDISCDITRLLIRNKRYGM